MQASIQLWSVRLAVEQFGWDRAIDSVARAGFTRVEPFALDQTADAVRAAIVDNALSVPTAHGFLDADVVEATLDRAAELTVGTVYHPWLDESHWSRPAAVAATADMLNHAADQGRTRGIAVGFHTHAHELRPSADGRTGLDRLVGQLSADVQVELDVNWAAVARVDPVSAVGRLGGRLNAVHLKDGPVKGSNEQQLPLGEGDLDLDGFVGALPEDTVLVLSLDQFAGSVDDVDRAVKTSRAWLDARGVS